MQGKRKAQRILIAEEDRVEAGILAFHLRRAGYKPLRVADQQEVVDALEWGSPAAIIADLDSAGINGLALAKSLEGSDLVFMLVANRPLSAAEELETLRLRLPPVLHKPIDASDLVERLRRSQSAVLGPPSGTPDGHIRGELAGRPLADIVRLGSRHHVDAYLSLDTGEDDGWLLLNRGNIIDAAIGERVAREAAIDLIVRDQGAFNLVPLEANDPILSRPDAVQCDLISLLARATAGATTVGGPHDPSRSTGAGNAGVGHPFHPLARVTLPDAVEPRPESISDNDASAAEDGAGWWKPALGHAPQPPVESRTRRRAPRPRPGTPGPIDEPQHSVGGLEAPSDKPAGPSDAHLQQVPEESAAPKPPAERTDEDRQLAATPSEQAVEEQRAEVERPEVGGHEDDESADIRGRLVPRSFFSGGRRPTRRPTRPGLTAVGAPQATDTAPETTEFNERLATSVEDGARRLTVLERDDASDQAHFHGHGADSDDVGSPEPSAEDRAFYASEPPPESVVTDEPHGYEGIGAGFEDVHTARLTTAEWDAREYYFASYDDASEDSQEELEPQPKDEADEVNEVNDDSGRSPNGLSQSVKNNLRLITFALAAVFVASFVYVVVQLVTGPSGTVPRPGQSSPSPTASISEFEERLGAAQLALQRKDYREAKRLFAAAVAEKEGHIGARAGLAKSLFLNQEWPEARSAFEDLAKRSPEEPGVYWHLAHVHAASGDIAAAEKAVEAFEKLAPSDPEGSALRRAIRRLR